ncbi:MAG: hypothetical protein J6R79_05520 [Bacteroidaceae bacterium]|nr:hypothetical protein [Bacteroidaceae bacterium]
MPTSQELKTMCLAGQHEEALTLALADLDAAPDNIWEQRKVGWVLYYMLSNDAEHQNATAFTTHLQILKELNALNGQNEQMLFENIFWKIGALLKNIPAEHHHAAKQIFDVLSGYSFNSSKAYSYMLKEYMKFEQWPGLVDFFAWWDLAKLSAEDAQPFKMNNGKTTISLAERTYIAYAKAFLRAADVEKITTFLPSIEQYAEQHPEMLYTSYYCGKLMLASGTDLAVTMANLLPFVLRKKGEFWVWQLLAEVYHADAEMQLACLTRAVQCRTQEGFLVKIRLKLAQIYTNRKEYGRAKYQLEKLHATYQKEGWRVPFEVQGLLRMDWMATAATDESHALDYVNLTNRILYQGAQSSVAVVVNVNQERRIFKVVYGERKQTNLRFSEANTRVNEGMLLTLYWKPRTNGDVEILGCEHANQRPTSPLPYFKRLEGKVRINDGQTFGFLKQGNIHCYIGRNLIKNITNGQTLAVWAVLSLNTKKQEWCWSATALCNKT